MLDYQDLSQEVQTKYVQEIKVEKSSLFDDIVTGVQLSKEPLKPAEQDLKNCAMQISASLKDGFNWGDIPHIIDLSSKFLSNFSSLALQEKREAVIKIIDYLIDMTDTPLLPDSIFDPIFKAMVPSFVNIIVTDSFEISPVKKFSGSINDEDIDDYVEQTLKLFNTGLNWKDIANMTIGAVRFVNQYPNMTHMQRKNITKSVIDKIIDKTDTPYLPDFYSDPIFKLFSSAIIDYIFDHYNI